MSLEPVRLPATFPGQSRHWKYRLNPFLEIDAPCSTRAVFTGGPTLTGADQSENCGASRDWSGGDRCAAIPAAGPDGSSCDSVAHAGNRARGISKISRRTGAPVIEPHYCRAGGLENDSTHPGGSRMGRSSLTPPSPDAQ